MFNRGIWCLLWSLGSALLVMDGIVDHEDAMLRNLKFDERKNRCEDSMVS
jgi:hypothetical protein